MRQIFTWVLWPILVLLAGLLVLLVYVMWPSGEVLTSVTWQECATSDDSESSYYTVAGEIRSDVDPIVFIHGRGSSAREFLGLAELLADRGVPSVLVNLRGHGPSPMPSNIGDAQWMLQALADDVHRVASLCAGLERYRVFGASFGGVVALELTKRHMDAVAEVTTFGTHLEVTSTPNWLIGLDRSTLTWPEWTYNAYQATAWCHFDRDTYQHLLRARGMFNPVRDLAMLDLVSPQIRPGEYARYDYRSMLEEYEHQGGLVSMVVGEHDWLINGGLGESLVFMDESVDRRVFRIPGGHYAHLTDPQPLADALVHVLR